jgi:hypothetical protein
MKHATYLDKKKKGEITDNKRKQGEYATISRMTLESNHDDGLSHTRAPLWLAYYMTNLR